LLTKRNPILVPKIVGSNLATLKNLLSFQSMFLLLKRTNFYTPAENFSKKNHWKHRFQELKNSSNKKVTCQFPEPWIPCNTTLLVLHHPPVGTQSEPTDFQIRSRFRVPSRTCWHWRHGECKWSHRWWLYIYICRRHSLGSR